MAQLGMAVDVAHASAATLRGILDHRGCRPFTSHTGVSAEKDMWRNLPDDALKQIALRGGVAGIVFAPQYLGGRSLDDVVRHIGHAVDVMGGRRGELRLRLRRHGALPKGMRDVRDLPKLAAALEGRMPAARVDKILRAQPETFFRQRASR